MYVILPHNDIIKRLLKENIIQEKLDMICFASNDLDKTKKLLYFLNNNLNDLNIIKGLTLLNDYSHTRNLFHLKSITNEDLIKYGFYEYNYALLRHNLEELEEICFVDDVDKAFDELKNQYSKVLYDFLSLEGLINIGPCNTSEKNYRKINELKEYHRKYFNNDVLNEIITYMNDENIV